MDSKPDFALAIRALLARPLAIAPEYLNPLVARLEAGASIEAADRRSAPVRSSGGTAVIPIVGPIQQREDIFSYFGLTVSVEGVQRAFRAALADDSVKSIVLDIDSPGGDVSGIDEMAAEILASRGAKPITAVANSWAASAAYYLASQADELVVTPSGMIGSIGVIMVHTDASRMYDEAGVTLTILRTPEHKAEANGLEPLATDARDYIQGQLNTYYGMFVDAVARGRGITAATVRDTFGGGRMVMAKEAVSLGMADRVATIDTVLSRHSGAPGSRVRAEDGEALAFEVVVDAIAAGLEQSPTPSLTPEADSDSNAPAAPSTEALYALVRSR